MSAKEIKQTGEDPRFSWRTMLPLLFFMGIAGLFLFGLQTGDPSKLPSALIGKPIPTFVLPPLEGLKENGSQVPGFSNKNLAQGKVSIMNIWASWCVPCRTEHPFLVQIAKLSGAPLYGLNYKDGTEAARRFLGRYGNPYVAVGVDDSGSTAIDWGDTIPCVGDPEPDEVCVPGGKYMMGCVPGDVECDAEEGPMVEVNLSPFFVDVHEVTHDELIPWLNTLFDGYLRGGGMVMTQLPDAKTLWSNRGAPVFMGDGDGLYHWYYSKPPQVETGDYTCFLRPSSAVAAGGMGWWGAKLYCEHHGKQLPTEAQWEAAARGQTLHEYPCGTDIEPCWWGRYDCVENGDCPYEYCFSPCDIPFGVDSPIVGCWSPHGVADMLDNAHEWVLDWMDDGDDHSWCAEGCTDPDPREVARPILKGSGVTAFGIAGTRSSSRRRLNDDTGNGGTGIRCVRPAAAPAAIPGVDGSAVAR